METNNIIPYRSQYRLGLLFIALSFAIYLLVNASARNGDIFSVTFFINYAFPLIYLLILLVYKFSLEKPRPSISYGCWVNVVVLLSISAFSLNRQMHVFATFPLWLNIYTLLSVPLLLVFPHFSNLPKFLKYLVYMLCGSTLVLSFYMFLYLIPLLPISLIALIGMGLSVHTFVPALWLLVLFYFLLKNTLPPAGRWLLVAGVLTPLLFLGFYLFKWQTLQSEIKTTLAEQNIQLENRLPNHLYLAQKLPSDRLTEEILVASFKSQRFWEDNFLFNNDGATRYHNPLATIAFGLFGSNGVDAKTVESILNIRKDHRHQTTRKLWTGTSLSTAAVSTNIRIFPEYRIAYHEKTFVIHNDPEKGNRDVWFITPTQEALYTFHLPEGSIVTSLSLWINGREEKSRLSTHQKADSAYKKIVGVERRDPALVHWQEGNRITVNVFPCTPNEDRQFKIGFTTPLKVSGNNLLLDNIWFEGPDFKQTQEVTRLLTDNSNTVFNSVPEHFKRSGGDYIYSGNYRPDWQLSINKVPLSDHKFSFGGYHYHVAETAPVAVIKNYEDIYLDLTKEWSKEEFDAIIDSLNSRNIFTWLPEKIRINPDNREHVWKKVSCNQFSFPFLYNISRPGSSLVITKTSHRSPVLADLEKSNAAEKFSSFLSDPANRIRVLNIGTEISPMWKSLRELRLISYEHCDIGMAIHKILSAEFEGYEEDSSRVLLHDSGIALIRTISGDSLSESSAPDHLLRLFAYNDIMRKTGPVYFDKEKYENRMFRQAEEAFVVTPVTSMIVLESEADYERTGIEANSKTVGNASILGGGAVPEPHEWLLITLVAFLLIRHLIQRKRLSFQ